MSEANGTSNYSLSLESAIRELQMESIINRIDISRRARIAFGNKRNYYDAFGYKDTLDTAVFRDKFERQGLARRIVRAYPDETWRLKPDIIENDGGDNSIFEKEWISLQKRLKAYHYMHRADVLAKLGWFSLIFIGFSDATSVDQLQSPVNSTAQNQANYLQVFSDQHVDIKQFDKSINSPRYGLPEIYEIDFDRQNNQMTNSFINSRNGIGNIKVHWSRVIHIADELVDDDIYGTPILQSCYNELDDILKTCGGGAEASYRNALRNIIIEANEGAVFSDITAMQENVDDFVHQYKNYLALKDATAKSLESDVPDIRGVYEPLIELISAATGIPKRILMGSERGELSSEQDATNWIERIMIRQQNTAGPIILQSLIDRFILYNILPRPKLGLDEYTIEWPPLLTEDPTERADRIQKTAAALRDIADSAVMEVLMPREEVREEVFGLPPDSPYEFADVVDATLSAQDDQV